MKQFAIVLSATLIGVLGALLIYDYLIQRPREQRIALDMAEARATVHAMADSAKVDLERVREQAGQITQEVDASVERSVAGAREAFAGQAREMERRRLANDAMARTAMYKTAVAESYLTNGQWPADDAAAIGLPDRTSQAGGAVAAIDVGRNGAIVVSLTDELAHGAKVRLTPSADDNGSIRWRCEAEGFDEFKRLVPACR